MTRDEFTAHAQQWLEENKPFWAAGTTETRQRHLMGFSAWLFLEGEKPGPNAVRLWSCAMLELGLARNTVIDRRSTLALFYKWAIEQGFICAPNPVLPIRTLVRQPSSRQPIKWEAVEKLLAYDWNGPYSVGHLAKYRPNRRTHQGFWPLAIRLGWETGLRLGDIATLQWGQLSPDGVLTVIPLKTKRFGEALEIPISSELHTALLAQRVPDTLHILPEMAESYRRFQHRKLSVQFGRAVTHCGVVGSFHGLRHAFVTRMLESNAPLAIVRAITGQSFATIAKYSHPSVSAKRRAMGILDPKPVDASPIDPPKAVFEQQEREQQEIDLFSQP